jgi:DNA-binding MarR family transcriptional regulator
MQTVEGGAVGLGWALGIVKQAYLGAASEVVADVPGGLRGFLVLATSGRGEPSSQVALAQHLGVNRTVMTYLLDDLERADLVERRPDPTDRRARRVVITERGRTLLRALQERLDRAEDEVLRALDEEERASLRSLMLRLATSLAPADPCAGPVLGLVDRSPCVEPDPLARG